MHKEIFINVTQHEKRVVVTENKRIEEFYTERLDDVNLVGAAEGQPRGERRVDFSADHPRDVPADGVEGEGRASGFHIPNFAIGDQA